MARRARGTSRPEEAGVRRAARPHDCEHRQDHEADLGDRDVLRREQVDEMAGAWPAFGAVTHAQRTGGLLGTLAGAVIGALLFVWFGLIDWGGPLVWRLAVAALCGAVAGATALGVYLGGREPELEGETQDADDPRPAHTPLHPGIDRRGR
jgi:hypothetical protein